MNSSAFNVDMLRLAREAHELTQAELAAESGVTQALISKIETGLIQPSEDVVEKFSHVLRIPIGFFTQSEKAVGFPPFHYRKRARMGAKPLARIGAVINIRRQHVAKLLKSYEMTTVKPIPQIDLDESGLTPERVAERLREYWMLPRGPVQSVVEMIERGGGIVILCRFGTALLDGISFRSEELPPLFFMNKDVPGDRLRFSLAHELGHAVMHTIPSEDEKMEEQANRFAAALLMPSDDIRPYLSEAKLATLGRVKAYWKVSIKSLIRRAHELKLMTDYQYKYISIEYNKAFKMGESGDIEVEQPTKLREIVRYHMETLRYSLKDLASLLLANEDDIQKAYIGQPGLRLIISN